MAVAERAARTARDGPPDAGLRNAADDILSTAARRAREAAPALDDRPLPGPGGEDRHDYETRLLTDALAGYEDKYPDVPVHRKIVLGRPSAVLVTESAGAALTVVGSRGRGGFAGLLLGSTSQTVLQHATGPVAVVRAHPTRPGS